MLRIFAALALLLTAWAPASAARLALVIGNDNYAEVTRLEKARNDATAIGAVLGNLGFSVSLVTDASRREMNRSIQDFVNLVNPGDTAMVFYAGHGVEIDGENYLLPIDTPDASGGQAEFISAEAISLDDLLERLRARKAQLNIVILDACRNNPFSAKGTRSLGGNQGLARISAPQGTFVMYSADVGEAALDRLAKDDPNPNSVFTRTLIPLLQKPGLDLVDTARDVRRKVRDLASTIRHEQTPAYYDAVLGDFFFTDAQPGAGKDPPSDPALPKQAELPAKARLPQARALFVTGGEKDSIRLWDAKAGNLISELEGEKIVLSTLAFIDGGNALAVAGTDGALFSYSLPQFKKTRAVYPGFRVTSLAQLPDGTLLAGGDNGTLAALSAKTWEVVWQEQSHSAIVSPILLADGGKRMITASADGLVIETDPATGKLLQSARTLPGKAITDITFVSASTLAAAHEDGTIAFINLQDGRVFSAFDGNKGWISALAAAPEGDSFVSAGVDGSIATWVPGATVPSAQFKAHGDLVSAASFVALDGRDRLVSAGFDGLVHVWDRQSNQSLTTLDHGSAILHFDIHKGS